jgi:hypothetical protein
MKNKKIIRVLLTALSFSKSALAAVQPEEAEKNSSANGCLTRCFKRIFGCSKNTVNREQEPLLNQKRLTAKPTRHYYALSTLSSKELCVLLSPTQLSELFGSLSLSGYNTSKERVVLELKSRQQDQV